MGVANQPRIAPFLDVACAPAHFHCVAGNAPRAAASAELADRGEGGERLAPIPLGALGRGEAARRVSTAGMIARFLDRLG